MPDIDALRDPADESAPSRREPRALVSRPSSFSSERLDELGAHSFLWGVPKSTSVSNLSVNEGLGKTDMHLVTTPESMPWTAILHVDSFTGSTQFASASGVLISDRVVLTAGHAVFDNNSWATELRFRPSVDVGRPIRAVEFRATAGWIAHRDLGYDYGVAFLDEPLPALGHFGICVLDDAELAAAVLHAAGFPMMQQQKERSLVHAAGPVVAGEREVNYDFYGGRGASGSPVWVRTLGGHRLIVAIHHRAAVGEEAADTRYAIRITDDVNANLADWIAESTPNERAGARPLAEARAAGS